MSVSNHFWGNYKFGAFLWILIGLAVYFLTNIYGIFSAPVASFPYFFWSSILFIMLGPYLTGILFSSKPARMFFDYLIKKFPRLFFLQYLSVGDIKDQKYPEVEIRIELNKDKYVYLLGFVTRRWEESNADGKVIWCRVAIPTYPLIATGNLIKIQEPDLTYTGRYIQNTTFTFLSFGAK